MQGHSSPSVDHLADVVGALSLSGKHGAAEEALDAAALLAFLDAEKEGAVLRLRKSLLTGPDASNEAQTLVAQCARWARFIAHDEVGAFDAARGLAGGVKASRLVKEDVPRTFANEAHRAVLLDTCVRLQERLGDYSQAMCFVAAFFSIFMPRKAAFALTTTMARSNKYVGKRWWDRVAFGTEAFAFSELLAEHDADVSAQFARLTVLPEAFTQRWFLALGVNVLPYTHLMRLMELFLEHGVVVLHRMGLAIVATHRTELLTCRGTGQCIALLSQPKDDCCDAILAQCASSATLTDAHLETVRVHVLQKYHARLVPAAGQDSTRKHTGETDSEDGSSDDDDDDEAGMECMACKDNMPDLHCLEPSCGLLLCESCHKKGKGAGHSKSHKTASVEDMDTDELAKIARAVAAREKE